MKNDTIFRSLCQDHGLPWDIERGYEPRWYNGPAPEDVKVLMLMAEPGPITPTEALNLLPAINHDDWIGDYDLHLQEHYWRDNLRMLCSHIWPRDTEANMYKNLGGSCTFWMSLPHGSSTDTVPREIVNYFLKTYFGEFLALFKNAIILAAGGKAKDRLKKFGVEFVGCWAFTRPGCNQQKAKDSWRDAGIAIAQKI